MAGRAVAARGLDLLHDGGCGRHGEPAAAIFFRNQRGEEARVGERPDEFGRIGALTVEAAPILTGELGAERTYGFADLRKIVGALIGIGLIRHVR